VSRLPALIACDLDGTLLDDDGAPAAGVLDALDALRAAAVAVVICTGRSVAATRAIAARLGLDRGLAIAYHGAVLVDVAGGRWVRRLDLPPDAVGPLVAVLRAAGAGVTAYVDDERWVQAEPECPRSQVSAGGPDGAPTVAREHGDLAAALDGVPVTRLIVEPREVAGQGHAGQDTARAVAAPEAVQREAPASALRSLCSRWPDLAVSPAPGGRLEIHHAAADKRTALDALCRRLGVPASAVVACGDGASDAGMLRWAGLGVAVAEGHEAALSAADIVVARADLGLFLSSVAGATGSASAPSR
jgi:hydroxymethylpyrimidine pyrophosphatase-like HAD family hydrolase